MCGIVTNGGDGCGVMTDGDGCDVVSDSGDGCGVVKDILWRHFQNVNLLIYYK